MKLVQLLHDPLGIAVVEVNNPQLTIALGYFIQDLNRRRLENPKISIVRMGRRKFRNQGRQEIIVLTRNRKLDLFLFRLQIEIFKTIKALDQILGFFIKFHPTTGQKSTGTGPVENLEAQFLF